MSPRLRTVASSLAACGLGWQGAGGCSARRTCGQAIATASSADARPNRNGVFIIVSVLNTNLLRRSKSDRLFFCRSMLRGTRGQFRRVGTNVYLRERERKLHWEGGSIFFRRSYKSEEQSAGQSFRRVGYQCDEILQRYRCNDHANKVSITTDMIMQTLKLR